MTTDLAQDCAHGSHSVGRILDFLALDEGVLEALVRQIVAHIFLAKSEHIKCRASSPEEGREVIKNIAVNFDHLFGE